MARFNRLGIFLVLLFGFMSSAMAVVGQTSMYRFSAWQWGFTSPYIYASNTDACEAYRVFIGGSTASHTKTVSGCTQTVVTVQSVRLIDNYTEYLTGDLSQTLACPANSTAVAGTSNCTCNAGFNESGVACVAGPSDEEKACASIIGVYAGYMTKPGLGLGMQNICEPYIGIYHCEVKVDFDFSTTYGTTTTTSGNGTFTGVPCTPTSENTASHSDVPDSSSLQVSPCKQGEFPGTVNGVSVCVPSTTSGVTTLESGSTATASTPSGSTSNPTSGLGADAPPSATTATTTYTTSNNVTTTTVTYKDGAGATVGEKSTSQSTASFCQNNPTAASCAGMEGGTGSFSGDCTAPPVCTGDALQCAIATQTHLTACALKVTDNAESSVYAAEKNLQGSQVPDGGTVDASLVQSGDLLGGAGAGGLADMTVTVWGTTQTIPLSSLNPFLTILGNIFLVFCAIASIKIIREA